MKNILFVLCLASFGLLKAQDTIYKLNGELLAAKILEINQTDIKYKRFNLPDGPLFITAKTEIQKIKFANGAVDSFRVEEAVVAATPEPVISEPFVVEKNPAYTSQNTNLLRKTDAGGYLYNHTRLSEKRMLFLAIDKNRTWKNKELDKAILATRDFKSNQYISGFGGAALAIGCILVAGSTANNSNSYTPIALSFNAIGIFIASQIISPIFKRKRVQNAEKVMTLFNQEAAK